MKYFCIAGETSGDLHGSNLMREILVEDPSADFVFVGGDRMAAMAKSKPILHTSELSFMGFIEVLVNLKTIRKNLKTVQNTILETQPDALILIDFPGFNLRIASFAKKIGLPVYYYISPKIWAWNQKRVHKIKKVVDRMFCILPFEKQFYKSFGMDIDYVGNPLMDAIEFYPFDPEFKAKNGLNERPIIALLPGSRKMEIKKLLPVMAQLKLSFPAHQILIAGAPNLTPEFYKEHLKGYDLPILYGQTYDLLKNARAAVVTSGTATLEAGLLRIPQVVVYKANPITVFLGRLVIKIRFLSLVNLINDFLSVRELIQSECTPYAISTELDLLLNSETYRANIFENYDILTEKVGPSGASKRTAKLLVEDLKSRISTQ